MSKKVKKEKKKKPVCCFLRGVIRTSLILLAGIWIGIHRRVIKSWLTGSRMPRMPKDHPHIPCH